MYLRLLHSPLASPRVTVAAALVAAALGLGLLLLGPTPAANRGQLAGLHGDLAQASEALATALARTPGSSHLRWQAGQGQLRQGDAVGGAATLQPLSAVPGVPSAALATLLDAELQAGQLDDALALYQDARVTLPPTFPPALAARLAQHWLAQGSTLAPAKRDALLRAALDFRDVYQVRTGTLEFAPLAAAIAEPGFWASAPGQQVKNLLAWAADPAATGAGCPAPVAAARPAQDAIALMGLPATGLQVGDDLVVGGDFEGSPAGMGALPAGWRFEVASGGNHYAFDYPNSAQGAFTAGIDGGCAASGSQAVRVDGLWLEPAAGMNAAYAGVQHAPIDLVPYMPAVVSLRYRTAAGEDAHLWLRNDLGLVLPPTQGAWRQAAVWLPATVVAERPIQPFLQLFSQGTAWFDRVAVQQIQVWPPEAQLPADVQLVVAE